MINYGYKVGGINAELFKRQTEDISERTYDIVGSEAIWFVPYMLEQFVAHQISFVIFLIYIP